MKIGAWKNFEELEDNLSLVELDFLIKQIRQDQKETRVFEAGLQGIDLAKYYSDPVEEKRQEIERRAAVRIAGAKEVERQELAELGFDLMD